jgi:hypothetical protein
VEGTATLHPHRPAATLSGFARAERSGIVHSAVDDPDQPAVTASETHAHDNRQTVAVNPEELLALLGWIPQESWRRDTVSQIVSDQAPHRDAAQLRRWLRRPQATLGRRSPLDALRVATRPDDPLLEELRRLAGDPDS